MRSVALSMALQDPRIGLLHHTLSACSLNSRLPTESTPLIQSVSFSPNPHPHLLLSLALSLNLIEAANGRDRMKETGNGESDEHEAPESNPDRTEPGAADGEKWD